MVVRHFTLNNSYIDKRLQHGQRREPDAVRSRKRWQKRKGDWCFSHLSSDIIAASTCSPAEWLACTHICIKALTSVNHSIGGRRTCHARKEHTSITNGTMEEETVLKPWDMLSKRSVLSRPGARRQDKAFVVAAECGRPDMEAQYSKLKDSMAPPWSCESVNTVGGFSAVQKQEFCVDLTCNCRMLETVKTRFSTGKWQRMFLRMKDLFECISGEIRFGHLMLFTSKFTMPLIILPSCPWQ